MIDLKIITFVSAGFATAAFADDDQIAALSIDNAFVFETPSIARTGAGFMLITNAGDTADRLVAVEGDFPRIELHTTEMDGDIAKMMKLEGIDVPPGATLELAPGGTHVMFMGLREPFEIGQTIPATLIFEQAGEVGVNFTVRERPAMSGMNSGHGDHSTYGNDS